MPHEAEENLVYEPAVETLRRQDTRIARSSCRRVIFVVALMFLIGLLVGMEGQHRYGRQVDRLSLESHRIISSILESGSGGNACENFKAMAGTLTVPSLTEQDLTGYAAAFYTHVKQLSVGSTAVSQAPSVESTLLAGLPVSNVLINRRFVRDEVGHVTRPIVVEPTEGAAEVAHTQLPIACGPCNQSVETLPSVPSIASHCQRALVTAIRAMIGCVCCSAGGLQCNGLPAVVLHPQVVCAQMPFTADSAAAALHSQSIAVQRGVRWLTPPDIARLAATFWPHDVRVKAPSPREEKLARETVSAVVEAANTLGFHGLNNVTVHVGWSATHLPRGPVTLPEHTTVDDLVLELTRYRSTARFLTSSMLMRWPEDPSNPEVTFAETEQALYIPRQYAAHGIPAAGKGALARSIAEAIADKIRPTCASDGRGDIIARLVGEAGQTLLPTLKSPILLTNDTLGLGPLQFFYIGASASNSANCRIGHTPDPLFAKAFECSRISDCDAL